MASEFPTALTIDGVELRLRVERKAVKNVNARMGEGALQVSIPQRLERAEAMRIIDVLARRLLRRQRARQINAEEDVAALARRVALRFPQPPEVQRVEFTTITSSCWGSYSPRTRSIKISAALRHMPPWVLEAVVAHELAHAIHPNHSPAFWALLRSVYPDTDRARAFLEGVAWLARSWESLPSVERAQLAAEREEQP
ncbi:M48 family metallopeptidase [Oscillochloris sp. ZM17-4]|uniref:M48 metallopeptidase family protein n=1 Tax=Oscillochloris sp. ZM17-4 TaxID=2866714 RepID=UPI001C72B6F1|nr:M48 family metallopeptidase [Oscillochloris sp. ZM17-4]MBX0330863.1 M48 family metallopeptidase [Oscillochloris sp. ZM17-4]